MLILYNSFIGNIYVTVIYVSSIIREVSFIPDLGVEEMYQMFRNAFYSGFQYGLKMLHQAMNKCQIT